MDSVLYRSAVLRRHMEAVIVQGELAIEAAHEQIKHIDAVLEKMHRDRRSNPWPSFAARLLDGARPAAGRQDLRT